MKNNLYYTPTIEELSVNQEVYLLDTGNYKAEYSEGDIYPMLVTITQLTDYPTIWVRTKGTDKGFKIYEVYPEQIGLKYLDREDIESLEWKIRDFHSDGTPMLMGGTELYFYIKDKYNHEVQFRYTIKDNYSILIFTNKENWVDYEQYLTLFQGVIKNKSELSKLMQQLNIK